MERDYKNRQALQDLDVKQSPARTAQQKPRYTKGAGAALGRLEVIGRASPKNSASLWKVKTKSFPHMHYKMLENREHWCATCVS